ncbi:MAG: VOC family protein [Bacteriovorax sp.]|nr:VOC family protein [Bacteriovorax sp.]
MNVDKRNDGLESGTTQKGMHVKAIPDDYTSATPYLYVNMAASALDFYQKAFGAKLLVVIKDDKNRIAHAEMLIGKAHIMLSDEFPEIDSYSPRHLGGTTSGVTLFFEDSDLVFKEAIAAGAQELTKVEDQFCGDRGGKIVDPFGHQWFINTRKENLSYDEIKLRGENFFRKH